MINYTKAEKRLQNRWPIVGSLLRRRTCAALADSSDSDPMAVRLLVKMLSSGDGQSRDVANAALRKLTNQEAIDTLCSIWVVTRTADIKAIMRERCYVAEAPLNVRVISRLAAGEQVSDPEHLQYVIEALSDPDDDVSAQARSVLRSIKTRDGVDRLCEYATHAPASPAARLCIDCDLHPSDQVRDYLLLFVTRQFDDFYGKKACFENLLAAYQQSDAQIKARVREVVREGDPRSLAFIGGFLEFQECSDEDLQFAIQVALQNKAWPWLFQALLQLPLRHTLQLLDAFRASGWEPEQGELWQLYLDLLAEDGVSSPVLPPKFESRLFDQWLTEGRTGELSRLPEDELVNRLSSATAPEGVKLIAALATKCRAGSESARVGLSNAHWMVRLASHICGLNSDFARNELRADNHWLVQAVEATPAFFFWPATATASDLAALPPRGDELPGQAQVRRVLALLIQHGLKKQLPCH